MIINTSQSSIVKDGLVLWLDAGHSASYPKAGTTWYDLSGGGLTGALTNGPTYDSANKGSIVFDGVNDYVDMGNIFNSVVAGADKKFSVSCFFNPGSTGNKALVGKISDSNLGENQRQIALFARDIGNGYKITFAYYGALNASSFRILESTVGLSLNEWQEVTVTYDGSLDTNGGFDRVKMYLNGEAVGATMAFSSGSLLDIPSGTARFGIGSSVNTGGTGSFYNFDGKIGNTRVYNRALSPSEIRQNFNAQKGRYGIATVPWTPSDITSLRAWYDADDSSTIFDSTSGGSLPNSGNDIARWEDKSGGGYHVTQATAANRPHYATSTLNGKPVIECNSQWLIAATASDWTFLHDGTGSTCALVWQAGVVASPNAAYAAFGTHGGVQADTGINLLYDDRSSLSRNDRIVSLVNRGVASTSASLNVSGDDAHTANVFHVVTMTTDPANATASDRSRINVDGNTAIANNAETNSYSSSAPSYALYVGAQGNANSPANGYIAEVVICNAKLSDADRQRVEGYLAHKWGLSANLPSTHPYKEFAPYKVLQ